MSDGLLERAYNPDVLSCLANLSNDEVFTPPEMVNQMLDMLPQDLFKNPSTTFLDPACKTGVFLREIAKRLIKGLEKEFPNLNDRLEHIFKNQLFSISITELTSLLSRRSVYCSKWPNGEYSIVNFKSPEGNIKFRKIQHTWKDGNCTYCGASKSQYDRDNDLESYAYQFIHTKNPEELFNMKFDVIIGNPPYQLSDGGAQASAKPIYNLFVEQAQKLNPRYLTMIIPSRWFSGGKGLDEFREKMLKDRRIRKLIDFLDASDCFPGVKIEGGVCYFLWDRDNEGKCEITTNIKLSSTTMERELLEEGNDTFIRYNQAIPIYKKVKSLNEKSFASLVSPRKPFGLPTNFTDFDKDHKSDAIKIYANKQIDWIDKNTPLINKQNINYWKVYITKAYGMGNFPYKVLNNPIIGEPNSCCTETYLMIGPLKSKEEANNIISYINTKFFRFLVLLIKNTQDATRKVYKYVPMQDFSKAWTDEELYKKYNLSKEEIDFIEENIQEMGGEN